MKIVKNTTNFTTSLQSENARATTKMLQTDFASL